MRETGGMREMRDADKKAIEEMAGVIINSPNPAYTANEALTECYLAVRTAEKLYLAGYRKQSEGDWISVEERLPEVDGRQYLVWDDVQATVKKRFFYRIPPNIPLETYPHIREYFGNVSDYKRFTHWMPLPEPPDMKGGAE